MPTVIIHDQHGFTQADRRALLLAVLTLCYDEEPAVTYSEEADGVTLYRDGVLLDRITWQEIAALEAIQDAAQGGQAWRP